MMGWRFINKKLDQKYGTEAMPKTAENLAQEFSITREDQDQFALRSQIKAANAQAMGYFADEITAVDIQKRGQ